MLNSLYGNPQARLLTGEEVRMLDEAPGTPRNRGGAKKVMADQTRRAIRGAAREKDGSRHPARGIRGEPPVRDLLADLSANFVNLPGDRLDGEIETAMHRVCEQTCGETAVLNFDQWRSLENLARYIQSDLYRRVLLAMELTVRPSEVSFLEASETQGWKWIESLRGQ